MPFRQSGEPLKRRQTTPSRPWGRPPSESYTDDCAAPAAPPDTSRMEKGTTPSGRETERGRPSGEASGMHVARRASAKQNAGACQYPPSVFASVHGRGIFYCRVIFETENGKNRLWYKSLKHQMYYNHGMWRKRKAGRLDHGLKKV